MDKTKCNHVCDDEDNTPIEELTNCFVCNCVVCPRCSSPGMEFTDLEIGEVVDIWELCRNCYEAAQRDELVPF